MSPGAGGVPATCQDVAEEGQQESIVVLRKTGSVIPPSDPVEVLTPVDVCLMGLAPDILPSIRLRRPGGSSEQPVLHRVSDILYFEFTRRPDDQLGDYHIPAELPDRSLERDITVVPASTPIIDKGQVDRSRVSVLLTGFSSGQRVLVNLYRQINPDESGYSTTYVWVRTRATIVDPNGQGQVTIPMRISDRPGHYGVTTVPNSQASEAYDGRQLVFPWPRP